MSRFSAFAASVFLFSIRIVQAAPCCGGASSLPSLITGDDRAQLSALVSQGEVIGDAPGSGMPVFRSDADSESIDTFLLNGSYRVTDDMQLGTGLPLIRRTRQTSDASAAATGLGDVTLDAAYEFLPEMTYSPWRPRGFGFLQLTLPTSPSVYDANQPFLVDARGRGFFSIALGSAFVKNFGNWDCLISLEAHRSFPRSFQMADGSTLSLTPGFGGSAIAGVGWSPGGGALRLGLSVSPIYEGSIRSSGYSDSSSGDQWVWNTSLQAGYAIAREWSASLSYTDQTLLGPTQNVSLSRTLAFTAQKRWEL